MQHLDDFHAQNGWRPVYHTLAEVEQFKAYINSIIKIESNSKSSYIEVVKPLTVKRQQEIRRWIENEQVLCALDCFYFESRYAYVCDEKGNIYKFQPRLSQKIYTSVVADFDEQQVSIEILCIKGRQLGITTQTALKFLHRMLFIPHTQAIMASVKAEASQLISRIIDTAYTNCPWWLVPGKRPKRGYDNGSILSVQSGMQATGLAQGWTPSCVHLCLTPNTLVRVANGMLKPISLVKAGDTVITKEGEFAKVKASILSPRTNELCKEIWLWGTFAPLGATIDHPIFTNEGWKRADEIIDGSWVRHPVRPITRKIERFRGTHIAKSLRRVKDGDRFWVNLNPAWGYICGLYLAEGSCGENSKLRGDNARATRLIFSIHENEVADVTEKLKQAFGKDQHIETYIRKGTSSAKLTVNLAHLARWMRQHFGAKDDKRVPDWAWDAGREFCLQVVKGYLDGDGHYVPDANEIYASSIRVQLPVQMRDLIASLGFGWSSIQYKSSGVYYERNCREQWTLIMSGETGRSFREHFDMPQSKCDESLHWKYDMLKENVDIEVESVADGFSREFYDIEVDHPSHSFLTAQCATHNSELADIPDPVKTIEEGLFRAAHSSKNLFMVLEGTGGGNTGWLADTWRGAKEDWPKGKSRLCPMFISWPMCPEIYPQPDWLRKFPVDTSKPFSDATRKHVMRCESYIRNTPYLARIAGKDYRMPIEQQWFWQFNYESACKNHTQKTWAAQMPADDFEALTGEHDSVFDPEVIMEIENSVYEVQGMTRTRREPVEAYAITGHDIDEAFYPDKEMIDRRKPSLRIIHKSHRGQTYEWTMVPLLELSEEKEANTMDRVLIYEHPKRGAIYSFGIDTADGLGKEDEDRTVLSVARNRFNGESDYQTAEFTSNRVNSAQVVAFCACLAAYYGEDSPDGKGVRLVIEQIGRPGETCQHQLKMMGFFNMHKPKRYDSKKINDSRTTKEGWWSSSWSVPILMTRFVEAVNGGWYEPRSRWLIEELKTLERHVTSGKSKMEHRSGQHDDRVRAAAQSFFSLHDMDVLTERAQKRYNPSPQKSKKKEKRSAGTVTIGSWDD